MKVIRIKYRLLHNEEWYNFFAAFKVKINRFASSKLGLEKLFDLLEALLDKVDKVLEVLQKSVHTKEIEEADNKRDNLFRGLIELVKALQKQPDSGKQKAAVNVYNLLSKYKDLILKGSFAEESSSIYNLVSDIREKYAADIALLGLTEWVNALENAEKDFLEYYDLRQQENVNKPKGDLRSLRAEGDRLYTAMINYLDAQLLADGLGGSVSVDPEDLDDSAHADGEGFSPEKHGNIPYNFVVEWNEEVKKYRNLLAQRAGRHAKEQMAADEEEEE
jgi:hypothetical protein